MKTIIYRITAMVFLASLVFWSSCTEDLDTIPIDDDETTSASIYKNAGDYYQVLAKCYAGLALTGQQGPAGDPDISGIDEGFSNYLRQYWSAQELPTDEAVIAWNDGNLRDYQETDWTATNEFIRAMYNRIYYQISLVNEFIRESTDSKLSDRGINEADRAKIVMYRAEARFLRAFSYWHALDMFGNVPFVTEQDKVGAFLPEQISRQNLFNYLETELLDLVDDLEEPTQNEYGRVDKAAAWMLLAKLYLNAGVYTGETKYTECLTYANNVINSGYSLHPVYQHLFLADNDEANGIIFPVLFDGTRSQTWGGTTFIIHAAIGGSMNDVAQSTFGVNGGWGGTRTTQAFVNKFADITGNTDSRAMFWTDGQTLEIADMFEFTNGYAITKFRNRTSGDQAGSDPEFPDTDWPVFRLADAYLIYAEAVLRGGTGGTPGEAVGYINQLRERAYGDDSGNITQGDLTLQFILDERARELYWEGHRRTDLIRFGQFTGDAYLWPWKGAVQEGRSIDAKFNLFPIPSSDINANPNLEQNPGY